MTDGLERLKTYYLVYCEWQCKYIKDIDVGHADIIPLDFTEESGWTTNEPFVLVKERDLIDYEEQNLLDNEDEKFKITNQWTNFGDYGSLTGQKKSMWKMKWW